MTSSPPSLRPAPRAPTAVPLVLVAVCALLCAGCEGRGELVAEAPAAVTAGDPSLDPHSPGGIAARNISANPAALRTLSNREYLNAVSDLLGVSLPLDLIKDWSPNSQFSGFDTILWSNFDSKFVGDRLATVERILDLAVKAPKLTGCTADSDAAVAFQGCAQSVLEPLAERAFRRPLRVEELAALQAVYDQGVALARTASISAPQALLEEGLRAALGNVLLAPQFLVRAELPPDPSFVGERPLDAYELASKLSFFFTGSLPDDALWESARDGSLLEQRVLEQHVERLLTSRTERFVETFMGQWLGVRDYAAAPADSLERAMWMETKLTLMELVQNGLPVSRLLNPGFTYLNQKLAAHYGIEGEFGAEFRRVSTDARGGVLQLGSVLMSTSTAEKTTPLRRGRWVQGRLLCKVIPLPGPELFQQIKEVSESIPADATVKERLNAHRNSSPVCYACHKFMDPIGLGLEGFDQQGRLRTHYDAAQTKPVETDADLLGTPFQTFAELNGLLAEMPDVPRCVAEKVAIQALGRVVESADLDADLVTYLAWAEQGRTPSFRDLVLRMVRSKAFRTVAHRGDAP